jgi:hypothetical protein
MGGNDFIQFLLAFGGTSMIFDFDNDGSVRGLWGHSEGRRQQGEFYLQTDDPSLLLAVINVECPRCSQLTNED